MSAIAVERPYLNLVPIGQVWTFEPGGQHQKPLARISVERQASRRGAGWVIEELVIDFVDGSDPELKALIEELFHPGMRLASWRALVDQGKLQLEQ